MDNTFEVIKSVSTPEYKKVIIETNNKRYSADLGDFLKVYCFPSEEEWPKVSIDSRGIDLVWPSRFEVHVDQVIDRAYKVEDIQQAV